MKSGWTKLVLALVVLFLLALAGIQAFIELRTMDFSRTAMRHFPGDRTEALIKLVACEKCSIEDRNHAVWTLGQLREKRALPVLASYKTHRRCDHTREICQYELDKAMARMMN
jgi:hypothetical protein